MNHVLHTVNEVQVPLKFLADALKMLLHTIVFARWPLEVRPRDVQCTFPLSYVKCDDAEASRKIDEAVAAFLDSTVPAGPDLQKGFLTLTFFAKRTSKVVFFKYEEKVTWEEWVLPILVEANPAVDHRKISALERERLEQESDARDTETLQQRALDVLTLLSGSADHVPPASEDSHDFEISCVQRCEQRGGFGARVAAAPPVDL
jgi:hypothetical protein